MKAVYSTHESTILEGDFEPPEPFRGSKKLFASRLHDMRPNVDRIGLKLTRGVGLWTSDGHLRHYLESGADIGSIDSDHVLVLENRFDRSPQGDMVRHALVQRRADTFEPVNEIGIDVPLGGCEYLVISPDKRTALATWLDQAEWGYVAVDLERWAALPLRLQWGTATISPPQYSPDARLIASCNFFRSIWWADEDADWEDPSPGGEWQVSVITLQDVASGEVSSHDLFVVVPPGWLPDDPEDPDWGMAWGPEWTASDSLRVWLPDNSSEELTLPLPPRIVIPRPLGDRRAL